MKRRLRLYLASPLFSRGEKLLNIENAKLLRSKSYRVFAPQELSIIDPKKASPEAKRKCFEDDLKAIKTADVVIACLNSTEPDSGTVAEVSLAFLLRTQKEEGIENGSNLKALPLCFKDDIRQYYSNSNVNNFVQGLMYGEKTFNSVEEMLPILEKIQNEIEEEEGSVVYGIAQYDFQGEIQKTKEIDELTTASSVDDIEKSNEECK